MSVVLYPPNQIKWDELRLSPFIFLAGSIEMGKAEEWQQRVINETKDLKCTLFNPRRADWDASWKQSIDNPPFNEQVTWELDYLELSDIIFLYLSPGTISPISLLELGLFVHAGQGEGRKIILCCPEGFARKGNVDIVAKRYRVPVYENLEDAIRELLKAIKAHQINLLKFSK